MAEISAADIDAARARDKRIRLIGTALDVEAELRDSPTIGYLMSCVRRDAEAALDELAELSPADTDAVAKALVNVRALVYVKRQLTTLRMAASAADAEVRAEDTGPDERDD